MDGTTTKEDVRIDKDDADELNREAAEDLERIENEVKREAEQYVEASTAMATRRNPWRRRLRRSISIAPKPRRKSCLSRPPVKPTKRSTKTIPLSERNYHG